MTNLIIWLAVVIGVISLILPLWILISKKKTSKRVFLSITSMCLSILSLLLLFFYYCYLGKNNDVVTLEDTIFGLLFGGNVLLMSSAFLNFIVLFTTKK